MSVYELSSVGISATGLLAVIVSLGFIRSQVRMMAAQTQRLTDALEMSAESALDGLFIVVTQAYVDHPELRPVFNELEAVGSLPTLDEGMTYRANAIAEMLLDAMERAIKFSNSGLGAASDALNAWILDSFRNSAFLRGWLTAHGAWYAPQLKAVLAQVHDELESPQVAAEKVPHVGGNRSGLASPVQ
jgi:hypothetical protein